MIGTVERPPVPDGTAAHLAEAWRAGFREGGLSPAGLSVETLRALHGVLEDALPLIGDLERDGLVPLGSLDLRGPVVTLSVSVIADGGRRALVVIASSGEVSGPAS